MIVRVWGCRGSLATPGADTVRYGGNTACIEVRTDPRTLIVLDAGTGLRPLGQSLEARRVDVIHVLLTHLHIDHILGLGFFPPLERGEAEVHVWGPGPSATDLQEMLSRYLSPPLFPVGLREACARARFHVTPGEQWAIGDALITARAITHQGPTLAYRVEHQGRSVAYLPDHEPARGGNLLDRDPEWISGYEIAHDADVLFHDAQYTDDEYREKVGWGHSTIGQAVSLARLARARKLIMFHHDPRRSDAELDELVQDALELWGPDGDPPAFGREGMEIDLGR